MSKGYISETMNSNRILSHNKIAQLPFSLPSKQPFSIFIMPKVWDSDQKPILVTCKLYQDDAATPCPFGINAWTEPAILEISADGVNLANYDIYWGAGDDVSES